MKSGIKIYNPTWLFKQVIQVIVIILEVTCVLVVNKHTGLLYNNLERKCFGTWIGEDAMVKREEIK